MKRNFLLLLCIVALMLTCFISCTPECEHPVSEEWTSDANNHWHATTCEHGEFRQGYAPHIDANEDSACDVCGREVKHEHTFSDKWSSDEEKHWKAATCTHTGEKAEEGLHLDDDVNGECDTCKAHVHILDGAGFCKGCGKAIEPVDETDIADVIAAMVVRQKKVVSGNIDYKNIITSSVTGGITTSITHKSSYTFGTNGTYINRAMTDSRSRNVLEENWIPFADSDNVIGISTTKVSGVITHAQRSTFGRDALRGYYFSTSTLADGYGPEDLLFNLYSLSVTSSKDKVSDIKIEHDAELNKYSYSYNILVINTDTAANEPDGVNYYEVTIKFSYDEDDYVLLELDVNVDCYTNSLADSNEHDYTYDQATQTITMKPNASADSYRYIVQQVKGEREEIEIKDGSEFAPTDLKLYTDSSCTVEAENVVITLGNFDKELYVGCAPEGTFVEFLDKKMKIKVTNQYGITVSSLMATLVGDVIQLLPMSTGEFNVIVTSGAISRTVNVKVVSEAVPGEYKIDLVATDSNSWTDVYDFKATVAGTYTFYCPTYGVGIWEKDAFENASDAIGNNQAGGNDTSNVPSTTGPYVDYQTPFGSPTSFSVTLEEGEVFSFYYMCAEKNKTFTIGYDVVPAI